jgi:hypothetical protein
MTSEETITRDLESRGWCRQFIAAEPRLSEAVEMYRELGFQVHLEPLPTQVKSHNEKAQDAGNKCRACFEGTEDQHSIIFTKPAEHDGQTCSD